MNEKEKKLWWGLYDACIENYKTANIDIPENINQVVDQLFENRLSSQSDDTKSGS